MQQGKLDEAISWLGKAKFEGAVQAAPGDVHAAKTLHQLRGQLN